MKRSLIILIAFAIFFFLWYNSLIVKYIDGFIHYSQTAHFVANYLLSGLVLIVALRALHKWRDIIPGLGLTGNMELTSDRGLTGNMENGKGLTGSFLRGGVFGVLCTLPMFIGYAVVGRYTDASIDHLICRILIAGLFEELVFRGFVFGQLFRFAGWGFLPSALIAGLVFGALHLYQGHDATSAVAAFGVTTLGAIFFSWLYVEWDYNLWVPIWLHTLMNTPWILFSVSDSGAVGGLTVNILRGCTIVLAIGLTMLYKHRSGLPYRITIKNLLTNAIEK